MVSLEVTAPDILRLQELKAPDDKFRAAALRAAGYSAVRHGQKSWNGVAILARGDEPVETLDLPVATSDSGQLISAALGGLACIWRDGYGYKKAGVMLLDLHPAPAVKEELFDKADNPRRVTLIGHPRLPDVFDSREAVDHRSPRSFGLAGGARCPSRTRPWWG